MTEQRTETDSMGAIERRPLLGGTDAVVDPPRLLPDDQDASRIPVEIVGAMASSRKRPRSRTSRTGQIVQLECLRPGISCAESLWGRVLTYRP
jgi:hypothetical protein